MTIYFERVTMRRGDQIIASEVRPATEAEIAEEKARHAAGSCQHTTIVDEQGWPYDFRSCATCGKGLGTI